VIDPNMASTVEQNSDINRDLIIHSNHILGNICPRIRVYQILKKARYVQNSWLDVGRVARQITMTEIRRCNSVMQS
jgi:hypothetical protein